MKITKKALAIACAIATSLSIGTTALAATSLSSNNQAYAADLNASITLDTASYSMSPNNLYDIGVTIKYNGSTLTGDQVKTLVQKGVLVVTDSRTGSIVNLTQLSNGNFRVQGRNQGSCYITYTIMNNGVEVNHASVQINVANGVAQGGIATRNTSLFDSAIISQALGLTPVTPTPTPTPTVTVTLRQAEQIAKSNIGSNDLSFLTEQSTSYNGITAYFLTFNYGNTTHAMYISAIDGSVLNHTSNVTPQNITVDQAKAIAKSDSKASSVVFNSAYSTTFQNQQAYYVQLTAGNIQHNYYINAVSGTIMSHTQSSVRRNITINDALDIALRDAGVSNSSATIVSRSTARYQGLDVYYIVFDAYNVEYTYRIDITSGDIVYVDSQKIQSHISMDEAKRKACNHAGISYSSAKFTNTYTTTYQGRDAYYLEFTSGKYIYFYYIDQSDGFVLSYSSRGQQIITMSEAIKIATRNAGVPSSVRMSKQELYNKDTDDAYYYFEFEYSNTDYVYEVRASDGYIQYSTSTPDEDIFITRDEAEAIALSDANVPDYRAKNISSTLRNRDSNSARWEVTFYDSSTGYKYTYIIGAVTGGIISSDSQR